MKLLFDENLSWKLPKQLSELYPDSIHVLNIDGPKPIKDKDIWEFATQNGYTIVTHDEDFYDIQMLQGFPPKIIWLRTGNLTTKEVIELFIRLKDRITDFLDNTDDSILEVY